MVFHWGVSYGLHEMVGVQRLQLQLINGAEPVLLQQVRAPSPPLQEAAGTLCRRRQVKAPGLSPPRLDRI